MRVERIAELLEPFLGSDTAQNHCHSEPARSGGEEPAVLAANDLNHISTYIDILLRWNARMNLTAIRDEEKIVTRHFGESLFAARHLFPRVCSSSFADDRVTLADVGSGAGFPGLPIKLWVPDIALTLIEPNHKKATFLREVVRALTLTDVDIQTSRAESLHGRAFSVVTLRAVERFETILPIAASLVEPLGRLALLIGSEQAGKSRALLPRFQWRAPISIPLSQSRVLAIAESSTP
jgi:16S rRNA (guanine527-N7)-methyltransferase